jgi:hypothetical protein
VTALRFAVAGWVVPLSVLALLLGAGALKASWTPPEEPERCWQLRSSEPEGEAPEPVLPPECEPPPAPAWYRAASAVTYGDREIELIAGAVLLGVMLNVFAIARGRPLRQTDARARLGYRLGVIALVLLLGGPLLFGAFITFALMSFPIRG